MLIGGAEALSFQENQKDHVRLGCYIRACRYLIIFLGVLPVRFLDSGHLFNIIVL
jgi:hypothetical protein